MRKGNKKDKNDTSLKVIVLVTAILNLIKVLIEMISKFVE